jgi:signal transduction histidine kinase
MEGQFPIVLTTASGLIGLAIGLYVLFKGPRRLINNLFFLMTVFMALWALGEAMTIAAGSLGAKMFWTKFQVFGEAPLVPTYLTIALFFPERKHFIKERWKAVTVVTAIYFPFLLAIILLYTTNLIYPEFALSDNMSGIKVTQSIYFWILTAIGFAETLTSIAIYLWERHRNPARNARMGLLIMALAPIPMLIANIVQGIGHNPYVTTPQAGFLFMALIGFGIMRYGIFVDIRSITKRLAVHMAVIAINLSIFGMLCAFYIYGLNLGMGASTYVLFVITGIPFMINYQSEVDWARRIADRYFSSRELEEGRLLQELSRSIRTVRNLRDLADRVVSQVRESMSLTACALFLKESDRCRVIGYAYQPGTRAADFKDQVDTGLSLKRWSSYFSFDDEEGTYSGCWIIGDRIFRGGSELVHVDRGIIRAHKGQGEVQEILWREEASGETISIPLEVGGEEVGFLWMSARPVRFSLEELDFIVALSTQVAVSLRNAQLLQELLDKTNRLQELVQSATTAQEEERMKIARELHDGLAPYFLDIVYKLETLEGEIAEEPSLAGYLDEVKQKAREGLRDLREVLADLRPSSLDVLGLEKSLATYLERFGVENVIEVEFHAGKDLDNLDPLMEVTFFRIAQEALSNISRHARAGKVEFFLGSDNGYLEMVVKDDGVGFLEREIRGRIITGECLGIKGMRERAELMRGNLRIESSPGAGTRINLSVPHTGI